MRAASGALAVILPLAPFAVYATMTDYSRPIIYAFMAITAALGAIGIARGRGTGRAGIFSAFSSMVLLALSTGYIPYALHISFGYVGGQSLRWLALSVALSVYAHFLGSVYDATTRVAGRMKEMGYGSEGLRELDAANAVVIGVGAGLLGASFLLTLAMEVPRLVSLAPLTALLVFVMVYLAAMIMARGRR